MARLQMEATLAVLGQRHRSLDEGWIVRKPVAWSRIVGVFAFTGFVPRMDADKRGCHDRIWFASSAPVCRLNLLSPIVAGFELEPRSNKLSESLFSCLFVVVFCAM